MIATSDVVLVFWAGPAPARWAPTVVSARTAGVGRVVVVTLDPLDTGFGADVDVVSASSLAAGLLRIERAPGDVFALATAPVVVPEGVFDRALGFIRGDLRVGCVCFLSNAAGPLSFPHRNTPSPYPVEGHDQQSLTTQLRAMRPDSGAVPIVTAAGALVLVPGHVLDAVGPLADLRGDGDGARAVAEFSLRMARRGFRTVLDAATYVTRPLDLARYSEPTVEQDTRRELQRAFPWFPAVHDAAAKSSESPLGLALSVGRAKVQGLRIVFDGSCLGPRETGTQVQTVALAAALADHNDVDSVVVGLPPEGRSPSYARGLFARDNVEGVAAPRLRFPNDVRGDILHRPFQPTAPLPWQQWRSVASRVVISILDLIAFDNGSYHSSGKGWLSYRSTLQDAVARADGVVVISDDVAVSVAEQALDLPGDRMWTVYLGTDHLDATTDEVIPGEFLRRGLAAAPFVVVLGAAYSHKNRDLAIRAWQLLRAQGYPHALVLAGVAIAYGSSRVDEAWALTSGTGPVTLPELSSSERTWLLRHAAAVLYPTSAEGFGLVPYEAAALGTPSVVVSFGPLRELLPDLPVQAANWSPEALAAATARLVDDRDLAAQQVAAVQGCGKNMTWNNAADNLVGVYRQLLARPSRGGGVNAPVGADRG